MALPKKLKNFNLFIDGGSYLGQVSEVTLPTLTRKMEEYRGGGMSGPVKIDMGMEALSMEFTMSNFTDTEIMKTFGICDASGVALRFRGVHEQDNFICVPGVVDIYVRGRLSAIERDAAKAGEDSNTKYTLEVSYYKENVNGEDIVELDFANMIEKIDGKDQLLLQRAALGIA